jgi:hypothetical protein
VCEEVEVSEAIDLELLRTSALFATAIACDAVVLTLCEFEANSCSRRALRWALWVTVAHWGLAAIGLSGPWGLRLAFPALARFVQLATAFLLCALIAQMLWQTRRRRSAGRDEGELDFAAKVWVVSVDALFVGGGESAVVGARSHDEVLAVLALLGPLILIWIGGSVVAARGISRLVSRQLLRSESVARAGAIGVPAVALPILCYLVFSVLRGIPPS